MPDALPLSGRKACPWIPHKPEDRLSIVVSRFLEDALEPPFYVTALADDDKGGTPLQRARGRERGRKPGQLDWDVVQGPGGLARKLELKRGKNSLSEHQITTCTKLMECGAKPVVAWAMWGVYAGLLEQGFRFRGNVETLLQKYEAQLDALDRAAELTLAGVAKPKRATSRKAGPRFTLNKAAVRRATKSGVMV